MHTETHMKNEPHLTWALLFHSSHLCRHIRMDRNGPPTKETAKCERGPADTSFIKWTLQTYRPFVSPYCQPYLSDVVSKVESENESQISRDYTAYKQHVVPHFSQNNKFKHQGQPKIFGTLGTNDPHHLTLWTIFFFYFFYFLKSSIHHIAA